MRSNGGFVESNAAEDEFAKLPFETGSIAIGPTGHGRETRQRRHQHRVMRKPRQMERGPPDPRRPPRRPRPLERAGEDRSDQIADLAVEQPGEFAIIEM